MINPVFPLTWHGRLSYKGLANSEVRSQLFLQQKKRVSIPAMNLPLAAITTASLFATVAVAHAQFDEPRTFTTRSGGPSSIVAGPNLVFDNISNADEGVPGAVAASTSSTPNTFMGGGYVLAPGTTSITGFDLYPVNTSGTSFTGLKLNIFVWGSVNMGTVNASTPAFGNLLGSYSLTSSGNFATGFYFPFESATPGITPGITLTSPLAIPSTTIGLTFNYQGTTDGVNYNNANSLTSIITFGTLPTTGSLVFNGYYRNANSEVNGNFTSTLRALGGTGADVGQGLGVRIYGTVVPEPTTVCLVGLGLGAWAFSRSRSTRTK